MGRVQDKICIVTGGALGLGEAAARMLAREGAKVVLTDIKVAEGEAAVETIRAGGAEALYLHHDVADEAAWEAVFAKAMERFGRVDVLVNNAGVGIGCRPDEQTLVERI